MKKKRNFLAGLLFFLLLSAAATVWAGEDGSQIHKIGVVVYDPESQEMSMFMDYYRDYLEEGFPVKFIFSGVISSPEEENDFILAAKEDGAEGIISFSGRDVENTMAFCEENEIYYVLGSGNISEEVYEAVADNPWFLGCVGPDPEAVHQSGCDMAEFFLEKGAKNIVIMTGGACRGNAFHLARARGMLEVFEKAGLVLGQEPEELGATEEIVTLKSEDGSLSVTLCPDYTENGEGLTNLEQVFGEGEYDTLMSTFHVNTYLDRISEKEEAQGTNIMVGAIDSFTESNFEIFREEDSFGNVPIDYIQGKYGSMAGPAFAMMYNAITGHTEANSPDGKAIRLYQGFWVADSGEKYIELYGYASGVYENAYSCQDLMQVIKVYQDDASPEALKELTESYTVEDVRERILGSENE